MSDSASFFGSAPPAVKFDNPGDTVTGEVLSIEIRQQTDFTTGKLLTWDDGRPKMQAVVALQCKPTDEDDDGVRNLYARGLMQRAIRLAVKASGQDDLHEGDVLTVTYDHADKPRAKGQSGAKVYTASIK